MSKGLNTARLVLFLIAGAALTYYLLSLSGSPGETVGGIAKALEDSDPLWLAAAFALFTISQVIRAIRWKLLSNRHTISLREALPLTSVHVGLGHLLPLRLSDLALVGLFRRYASLPTGSGAATVMLSKVMDLIAMGSVVAFSFLAGLGGPVVYAAAATAIAGVVSLFFMPRLLGLFTIPLKAILGEGRITSAWRDMLVSIRITPGRRRSVSMAMAASIAAWATKLFMLNCLLMAVGVRGIPLWQAFTAFAITDLTMALPIHGLLSLGTVEAGWVAGFALMGLRGELPGGLTVVEAGFSVHLLWLSMAVLLMLAGSSFLVLSSGKESD